MCAALTTRPPAPPRATVVLDWDGTLALTAPAAGRAVPPLAFALTMDRNGTPGHYALRLRPGLHATLDALAAHYTLVLWTFGVPPYIDACLAATGLRPRFAVVRARPPHADALLPKNLAQLGTPPSHTLLVDDDPAFARANPCHWLPMPPWAGDPTDRALAALPGAVAFKLALLGTLTLGVPGLGWDVAPTTPPQPSPKAPETTRPG